MRADIRFDRASRPVVVLLALVAVLLLAGFRAMQEPGRVVGRVTDTVGNPLQGAAVSARHADPGVPARAARSGETGGFQLSGLVPGRYTVRAEHEGYVPGVDTVELTAGERRAVILRLRTAPR